MNTVNVWKDKQDTLADLFGCLVKQIVEINRPTSLLLLLCAMLFQSQEYKYLKHVHFPLSCPWLKIGLSFMDLNCQNTNNNCTFVTSRGKVCWRSTPLINVGLRPLIHKTCSFIHSNHIRKLVHKEVDASAGLNGNAWLITVFSSLNNIVDLFRESSKGSHTFSVVML